LLVSSGMREAQEAGCCELGYEPSGFCKMWVILWPAKELWASEGHYSRFN